MENKFKVGDIVYDEVNFPNKKGNIIEISKLIDGEEYIIVDFNDDCKYYTFDGRLNEDLHQTLSHTPYTIEFKCFSQERPKVLTDEMKVCIKGDGTTEYGEKIIKYFLGIGGGNSNRQLGYWDNHYFLDASNNITNSKSIPEGYKEISLKEDESHICKYCKAETTQPDNECYMANINYVGKKIVFDNDRIELIISQDKEHIETSMNYYLLSSIDNYKIID